MHLGESATRAAYDSGFESVSGFNDAFKNITGMSPTQSVETTLINIKRVTSPLGIILLGAGKESLVLLEFGDRRKLATQLKTLSDRFRCPVVPGTNDIIEKMETELDEYFCQERKTFTVPLSYPGTEFQSQTWSALQEIPYGETCSYQDLANVLGKPKAVRAVANANGCNRIAIVIPCHRVIGSDGTLTGYGGGLWRKQRLLELEGAIVPQPPELFD
jgi:AraC family transcriptional regulator of adaptative response/methylated-DNA-[protein]-cysteine methyltransferase